MGFNAGTGGGSPISGSSDVALNTPITNNALVYDGAISKWKNLSLDGRYLPNRGVIASGDSILRPVGKGELVFNVLDYGALGDGGTDDTDAIMAAVTDALATSGNKYGGVVYFPPSQSSYRYTQLSIIINSSAQITLRGAGNASLRPLQSSDNLGPSIVIKPLTPPSSPGAGFLKHVKIEHLTITGSGYAYAPSRINDNDTDPYSAVRDREGIRIECVQDLVMRDVYISHFKIGMHVKDLFDSTIDNVQFMSCGYSIDDTDVNGDAGSNFTTGFGYSLWLDEFTDQSNANKFTNCHFEGGPLFVRFSGGSRQNYFTSGTKFENRTVAADDTSTKSSIWAEDIVENFFIGCMITEDYTRDKSFIRSDASTSMASWMDTNNTRQRLVFSACHIQSNSMSKIRPFYGVSTTFADCVFDRVDGSAGTYPFVASSGYVSIHDSQITWADAGRNLIYVNGRHVQIHDLNLIAKTESTTGNAFQIGSSATDGSIYEVHAVGTVGGLIASSNSDFGSFRIAEDTADAKTTSGSVASVSGIAMIIFAHTSATNFTYFSQGHQNKRLVARASTSNTFTTLVHDTSKIVLKSGANRTLAAGEMIEFINDAGVWREV